MASLAFAGNLLSSAVKTTARRFSRRLRPTWSWGFEVVAMAMKARAAVIEKHDWADQRRMWGAMTAPPGPIFREVTRERVELAGMKAEWFVPKAPESVVLYIHGGSFIYGSIATHAEMVARVAVAAKARVVVFEYRLAPEHPFPAAFDDVLAAYRALRAQGHERIILAGDSAGGNLAAALAIALRDAGDPPAAAVLLSPWVDLAARGGSLETNAAFDYAETGTFERWAECYLASASADDPRASPLRADLSNLPPLFVVVGTAEMLLDQVRAFADKARAAGTRVELFEDPDMIHNGLAFAGLFARCREVERRIGAFVKAVAG